MSVTSPSQRFAVALLVLRVAETLRCSLMMTVPIAGAFGADTPRARKILPLYALALGALGLLTFALSFYDFGGAMIPGSLFILGFFLYGWVANALTIRT